MIMTDVLLTVIACELGYICYVIAETIGRFL